MFYGNIQSDKRVFKVFDLAFPNGSNVEPHGKLFARAKAIVLRDPAVSPLLFARYRLGRQTENITFARLDLHERVHVPLARDNVRLAEGRYVVAF